MKRSRLLSYILRHHPEQYGLHLDSEGWVNVSLLLEALEARGESMSMLQLREVVESNDKRRFAFSADLEFIRAVQGHSVSVDLEWPVKRPPERLYHGTVKRFLESIRENGLLPMERHHVHLSANYDTARQVGERRGHPVVLQIDSLGLHQAGRVFRLSENGVWLIDEVPPGYLTLTTEPI
jgi:putative RNA 2'-phosphotransferase